MRSTNYYNQQSMTSRVYSLTLLHILIVSMSMISLLIIYFKYAIVVKIVAIFFLIACKSVVRLIKHTNRMTKDIDLRYDK